MNATLYLLVTIQYYNIIPKYITIIPKMISIYLSQYLHFLSSPKGYHLLVNAYFMSTCYNTYNSYLNFQVALPYINVDVSILVSIHAHHFFPKVTLPSCERMIYVYLLLTSIPILTQMTLPSCTCCSTSTCHISSFTSYRNTLSTVSQLKWRYAAPHLLV